MHIPHLACTERGLSDWACEVIALQTHPLIHLLTFTSHNWIHASRAARKTQRRAIACRVLIQKICKYSKDFDGRLLLGSGTSKRQKSITWCVQAHVSLNMYTIKPHLFSHVHIASMHTIYVDIHTNMCHVKFTHTYTHELMHKHTHTRIWVEV
jgi:hypothetical protein